ncbi:MAG: hypothetical protein IID41_16755 [Planctomycetes bacterium]|nr:hypothetical protein [Planctomycetota bacterium]
MDVLRGSMPEFPVLDLPVDQIEVFDRLTDHLYASLIQEAEDHYPILSPDAWAFLKAQGAGRRAARLDTLDQLIERMRKDLVIAETERSTKQALYARAKKRCDDAEDALEDKRAGLNVDMDDRADNDLTDKDFEALREALEEIQTGFADKATEAQRAREKLAAAERLAEAIKNNLEGLERERERRRLELQKAKTADNKRYEASTSDRLTEIDVKAMARLAWFGSLSRSDIASIGMNGDTDPFKFRKLVFWATANNLDLNQFAGEIDGVIDNVISIAEAAKRQAKRRKLAREQRRNALLQLANQIPGLDFVQKQLISSFVDVLTAGSGTATTTGTGE